MIWLQSSSVIQPHTPDICSRWVFTMYRLLQILHHRQIFLYTSYIFSSWDPRALQKIHHQVNKFTCTVCCLCMGCEPEQWWTRAGTGICKSWRWRLSSNMLIIGQRMIYNVSLMCLLLYLMFGMNGKAPGSCNGMRMIPKMSENSLSRSLNIGEKGSDKGCERFAMKRLFLGYNVGGTGHE